MVLPKGGVAAFCDQVLKNALLRGYGISRHVRDIPGNLLGQGFDNP